MKKCFAFVLVLAIMLLACAAADEPAKYYSGSYEFIELKDGTVEITNYYGYSGPSTLSVPEKFGGKRVTRIGASAFTYSTSLKSITIPDGVIYIGESAFAGCSALTSITIPDSVRSIGDYAFSGCDSLVSITIPDSVTQLGVNLFQSCGKLTSIHVNPSHPVLETIDGVLFNKTTKELIHYPHGLNYATYVVPDGTLGIGAYVFYRCKSLASITIPDSVRSIGDYAFSGCSSLTSIIIPDSVRSIGDYAFSGCGSLASIAIPDGVTNIGDYVFSACTSLTSITIPDSVTQLGANPFRSCSKLVSIHVDPSHPVLETIDGILFNKTTKELICYPCCLTNTEYAVPDGTLGIGAYAFESCEFLTSITLPDGVTSIEDGAFGACTSLTSITLPEGVTSIGEYAFSNCRRLTSITLPEGVTSIGDHAFDSCQRLTSITLLEGVTSIGDYAFSNCRRLMSITLPTSVTSIGKSAMYRCSDQLVCIIPASSYIEQWCEENGISYVYGNTQSGIAMASGDFLYFPLPDQTAQIFGYTGGAQQLILPAELDGYPVVSIADGAFARCTELTSVTIPDSVTTLEGNPFGYCGQLTDLWVSPDHPTLAVIDSVLFDKTEKQLVCYPAGLGASDYAVPNGILSIGEGAFGGCAALTSVTLPDTVIVIGEAAFDGCAPQLTFAVSRDSYAVQWCKEHQVRYTYPDANNWLLN